MSLPENDPHASGATAPGGLLAVGSRVKIDLHLDESDGRYAMSWTGTITDIGSVPAPYIALTDSSTSVGMDGHASGDIVLFVGPGYAVKSAAPTAGERQRVYIGGPLNNQPVEKVGDHWSHFRDDDGNPIPDEVGDAEWSGPRQRYYYWSPQAPGGTTYVHLTWIDESGRVTG